MVEQEQLLLTAEWDEFKKQLKDFINKGSSIYESHRGISSEEQFNQLNNQYLSWNKEVIEFLKHSFNRENNDYASSFAQRTGDRYVIPNTKPRIQDRIKERQEDLRLKTGDLSYYLKLLSISDAIIRPNEVDIEDRNSWSTNQVLNFLLGKLLKLYDDNYHSIVAILEGNGIKLRRYDEDREIAKTLETTGFVQILVRETILVKLTLQGKSYVEEMQDEMKKSDSGDSESNHLLGHIGDNNMIIVGNNNTQFNLTIKNGNFDSLEKVFQENGIEREEINELRSIIDNDNKKDDRKLFGDKVNKWIKKMISKSLDGSWQIGLGAAGSLLAEGIKKYYGW